VSPQIAAALGVAMQAIAEERLTHGAMLDGLAVDLADAVRLHDVGDLPAAHERCRSALDTASDALGTCEDIEPLTALLGYVECEVPS
jgi:hypothetical protein